MRNTDSKYLFVQRHCQYHVVHRPCVQENGKPQHWSNSGHSGFYRTGYILSFSNSISKLRLQVLFFSSSSLSSIVQDGEGRSTDRCQTCEEETVEHLPTQQRHCEEQAFDVFRQPKRFLCSHNARRNVCPTEEESVWRSTWCWSGEEGQDSRTHRIRNKEFGG